LDDAIHAKLGGLGEGAADWIYFNDIENVWQQFLNAEGRFRDTDAAIGADSARRTETVAA
jgi:hypothetical protein